MKIKNILRGLILLAILVLVYIAPSGYADISSLIILYFISEYLFLLEKKRKPLLVDSNGSVAQVKKILMAIVPGTVFLGFYYIINTISPNPSNIKPATTVVFIIIALFMTLFLDIKSRQVKLYKSVYWSSLFGIIILILVFLIIILI